MVFGTNKEKIKIVWLCHFVNKEMKEFFNTPQLNELAPWINNLIILFQSQMDLELHIIAPNVFTNQDVSINKNGVNYHFYKRFPIPSNNRYLRKINTLFQIEDRTNYFWIKRKIELCVNNIKPDIIHLHGAENPYYSAGIIPLLKKFRFFLTIQGFIKNTSEANYLTRKKIQIEENIIRNSKYIGVGTDEMKKTVTQMNSKALLYFHNYAIKMPQIKKENHGKNEPIDCIYFARVCKDKGIEDLLEAIAFAKRDLPSISLSVIGGTNSNYLSYLKTLCIQLNIESNVQFLGFFPNQESIFEYALQAKIYILPTHHDIMPGTIIESMFMKLPVVAYAIGGIPELNHGEDRIILVEKENTKMLAVEILKTLNNTQKRIEISERAYLYAMKRFNGIKIKNDILKIYKQILEH